MTIDNKSRCCRHKFFCHIAALVTCNTIHSFVHSGIYKAPLQEIYSEAPPAQPRQYISVLSNLQNTLSLFLGRRRISKGSLFQIPTMENARHCLVAVVARGTNSNATKPIR